MLFKKMFVKLLYVYFITVGKKIKCFVFEGREARARIRVCPHRRVQEAQPGFPG